jgi:hypothetical protein
MMIGPLKRVIRAHETSDDASEGSALVISVCERFGLTMLDAIVDHVALLTPLGNRSRPGNVLEIYTRVFNSHGTATGPTI